MASMPTQSEARRPRQDAAGSSVSRDQRAQRRLHRIVRASWQRCIEEYGLEPEDRSPTPTLERQEVAERLDRIHDVLAVAEREMDLLHQRIRGTGFSLVLTDTEGVVLRSLRDEDSADTHDFPLRTGSIWSEAVQGTNGIGTCLVEGIPVTIHRRDHFLTRNAGLTCTGAPIRLPDGSFHAVLDASGTSTDAQSHTLALVRIAAQIIENRLLLRLHADDYILRFHPDGEFLFSGSEALIALDDSGRVLGANPVAVGQLEARAHDELIGKDVEGLFNTRMADLVTSQCTQALHPQDLPTRGDQPGPKASLMLPRQQAIRHRDTTVSTPARTSRNTGSTGASRTESVLDTLDFGDPTMGYNIRAATRVVEQDVPLLLHGETGTGKEAFSRAVHEASSRGDQPFVAVNCAAIPESLIESELFGYRPGAFTGASRSGYRGKIAQADGGTLFLDEIGDMPVQLQARLLRVLETKEVIPLGGTKPEQIDIRVIAATHRSVRQLIGDGLFREDLYYRLAGVTLTLPPLRERGDKARLIEHIIRLECGARDIQVSPEVLETFQQARWPGNIRQLRLVTRTALAMTDDGYVERSHLPPELFNELGNPEDDPSDGRGALLGGGNGVDTNSAEQGAEEDHSTRVQRELEARNPLEAAERAALIRELERNRWNITRVSRKLDVCRNTLYRKMRRYDIRPPQD